MKDKTKMIVSTIFIALVCLLIVIGATAKIIGAKQVVEGLTHLGVGDYVKSLGLMEILFVALFLHSTTSKVRRGHGHTPVPRRKYAAASHSAQPCMGRSFCERQKHFFWKDSFI